MPRIPESLFWAPLVGVLEWTRTWWSGVDDKKVKERAGGGKGRERARKKERHGNPSSDGAKVFY